MSNEKTIQYITYLFAINKIELTFIDESVSSNITTLKFMIEGLKGINKLNLVVKTLESALDLKINSSLDFNILTLKLYNADEKIYLFENYISHGERNKDEIFLGIGQNGCPIFESVDNLKSLLIGGSSGFGKSNLLHQIILSYLLLNDNNYLMLIDPKYTEFSWYKKTGLKNRLLLDVASTFEESEKALYGFSNLIDERFRRMKAKNLRFSDEPSVLLVIDEYASLFTNSYEKKVINNLISRIASLGRAARCYLIIATQHPTNSNLTNGIRVNLQSKLALHCESRNQSFNIPDSNEAIKLKEKGDFILKVDGSKEAIEGRASLVTDSLLSKCLKA